MHVNAVRVQCRPLPSRGEPYRLPVAIAVVANTAPSAPTAARKTPKEVLLSLDRARRTFAGAGEKRLVRAWQIEHTARKMSPRLHARAGVPEVRREPARPFWACETLPYRATVRWAYFLPLLGSSIAARLLGESRIPSDCATSSARLACAYSAICINSCLSNEILAYNGGVVH